MLSFDRQVVNSAGPGNIMQGDDGVGAGQAVELFPDY
jgi:hypothetical protein